MPPFISLKRGLGVALLLGLAISAACDDQRVAPTPLPQPQRDGGTSSSGSSSGGSTEGWGDPASTKRPGVLRIAQLNVRRYFDTVCESNDCEGGGFEEVVTEEQFNARTEQLATSLARLEADVITLAEVENQTCLDALQAKLRDAGFEYPVAHVAEIGTPGTVDVAVLSRGKLEGVKTNRKEHELVRQNGSTTVFTREFPEISLTIGESSVIVFAAHFRAKADDDPERRLLEAKKARELMVATGEANTGALVLLGGDLNDVPGSPPIDALEEGDALVRVAKDLPAAAQGTYEFGGEDQAIDHIFTTAARATAYVAKSAKVERDSGAKGFGGSDHAAIYADFNLP